MHLTTALHLTKLLHCLCPFIDVDCSCLSSRVARSAQRKKTDIPSGHI